MSQPAERVGFVHGAIGTTVTGSVRSGDQDTYVLSGLADVTLTVDISSVPDTAVFDVYQPNGLPVARDATTFQARPPQDVECHVVVRGGSQANDSTTYGLKILTGP